MTSSTSFSDSTPRAGSGFSFRRVLELAHFYRPIIEKQTLVYGIISIGGSILLLLPVPEILQIAIFTIVWTILPFMIELAPCILGKSGDSRIVERLLPASAAEKLVFRLIYFWIVIPAVTYVLPWVAALLYMNMPDVQTEDVMGFYDMMTCRTFLTGVVNVLTMLVVTTTCMYFVTLARHNRVLKGIIAVICSQVFISFFGAAWGFWISFNAGVCDALENTTMYRGRMQLELQNMFISSPIFYIMAGVLAVWLIVAVVMNYKILKYRNL